VLALRVFMCLRLCGPRIGRQCELFRGGEQRGLLHCNTGMGSLPCVVVGLAVSAISYGLGVGPGLGPVFEVKSEGASGLKVMG